MRWVFALLLLGNGIYFFFHSYMSPPVQQGREFTAVAVDLGEPVVLLAEAPQDELVVPQETQQVQVKDEPAPMCWMLGSFNELVSAKQVVGRLEALDIKFAVKAYEVNGKPDYWVHVPPRISRKLAVKQLRELQLKKIDSFLITEGELANGISLGLFSEKVRAERLYKLHKEQGLVVELKEVPRVYKEFWLVSEQGEYAKFSDPLWKKIKESSRGIERRKNYCNKIASPENLD